MKTLVLVAALICLACLDSASRAAVATPSDSKLSIHLINNYTTGATAIVAAHPRVLKILGTGSSMMAAARDFKANTPGGIVVCRIYTTKHYSVTDDPAASGQDFWNTVLAPALNPLSASDKALIDYVEGPNEGDSTPTWNTLAEAQWYSTFWLTLAPMIAQAGYRPCAFSISVGNPPGDPATVQQSLDAIVPALRLCQALGGAWSYHPYTIPYTQDAAQEIWYSLRYRQWYQYFAGKYPDLTKMPLIFTEGGVDGQSTPTGPGWLDQGAAKYESWLQWWDGQIRQDPYVIGCTLFEIGNPGGWQTFDLEPISGWMASYLSSQRGAAKPAIMITPLSLSTTTTSGASPGSQKLTIRNSGDGTLNYSVSGLPSWMSVTPSSGTSAGDVHTLTVSYSTASLSPGVYNASITVTDANASNTPQNVPVTVTVNPFTSAMPGGTNLALSAVQVLTDSDQSSATGGAKATDGTVSTSSEWISGSANPPHWLALDLGAERTVNGFVVRHCAAAGGPAYYNTKSFEIQSAPAMTGPWTDECVEDNSAQASVTTRSYITPKPLRYVRLLITNAGVDNTARIPEFEVWGASGATVPAITVSPATLTPSANYGSSPAQQTFVVQNSGGGTLNYSIKSDVGWLSVKPSSGTSTGEADTLTVTYSTSGMAAGAYNGTISISDTNATNNPQTVGVTLTINDVTPPSVSSIFFSPHCARSTGSVAVTASILDNTGGSGVDPSSIMLLGPNILSNPSFESGLTGWSNPDGYIVGNTYPSASPAKDGAKYVGESCAYGSGTQVPELRQTVTVTPGMRYQLSAWVFTDGSPNLCSAYLQYKDGPPPTSDGQCATIASFVTPTSGWQQMSGTVTPSTTQLTITLRLSWDCSGSGGGGNFDLASVRQAAAPDSYDAASGLAQWSSVPPFPGYSYVIQAADNAGNTASASAFGSVVIDDAAPSTTASAPAVSGTPISVSWTAADNGCNGTIQAGSVQLWIRKSTGSWMSSALPGASGASGTFKYSPAWGDGTYYFQVVAADGLGNAIPEPTGLSGFGQASTKFDSTPPGAVTVTAQGPYTPSLTTLKASWTAASDGAGSGIAGYQYAVGTSSTTQDVRSWTPVGNVLSVTDSSLPLTDGKTYYIQVRAVDNVGLIGTASSSAGVTVAPGAGSIGAAWPLANGIELSLRNKSVTAAMPGVFWLEEMDRSAGIMVTSGASVQQGDMVSVSGVLGMSGSQRALIADGVVDLGAGTVPRPLSMLAMDLGGKAVNAATPGVTGSAALYNVGLLVSCWGQVTYSDATDPANKFFYVDDGTGPSDGSGHTGVRVLCGTVTPPASGWWMVTGIVGSRTSGGSVVPVVVIRGAGDVLPL